MGFKFLLVSVIRFGLSSLGLEDRIVLAALTMFVVLLRYKSG